MRSYGIKIAKNTKTIDSGNVEDYIYNSKYATRHIKDTFSGSITTPTDGSYQTWEYTHNFGYKPQFYGIIGNFDLSSKLNAGGTSFTKTDSTDCIAGGGNVEVAYADVTVEVTDTKIIIQARAYIECIASGFGTIFRRYKAETFGIDGLIFMESVDL